MRNLKMRIVAVCVVFHIKLRWPKREVDMSHSFQVTAFSAVTLMSILKMVFFQTEGCYRTKTLK